jgi:RTX calcium-binding nonapeptide repeat (4 copies)
VLRTLLGAAVLALLLASTAAAATIQGTARADLLRGTARGDRIHGLAGNDRINAIGGGRDTLACGRGRDIVTVDETDRVGRDCEVVSRRIANDRLTTVGVAQHRTQLESHSLANGSTVVSVFQNGRFVDGAATAIGFSTSTNGGRTWRSGLLPGVTRYSPSPGESPRASDPVVAYDALHGVWLANALIVGDTFSGLFVNRSMDGLTWSAPVTAARANSPNLAYDKNWIVCDNGAASPFRGSCYIAYNAVTSRRMVMLISRDGGVTWSPPVTIEAVFNGGSIGAVPVVQPDGALTVVYIGGDDMVASRSTDGGLTFGPPAVVSQLLVDDLRAIRAPPLPAATVDASGRIYMLWMDCRARSSCNGNDLVLSTSTDGVTWSAPARLPRSGFDYFVPGIAAHPTIAGRVAVVTYLRTRSCAPGACRFGVAFLRSTNGGATWSTPQRLEAEAIQPGWVADSNLGAFLGDYVGIAYTPTAAVPTFPFATRPSGRTLNEAMFASVFPG